MEWILKNKALVIKVLLYLSWATAIASMLGSLYFSEILHFPPCTLCWWQRIFMYPIVFIMAVGIILRDQRLPYYVLPLGVVGTGIALYQNLLTWGVITESLSPCSLGVSCTTKYIEWLGFISIPFLSLVAFVFITVAMGLSIYLNKPYDKRS